VERREASVTLRCNEDNGWLQRNVEKMWQSTPRPLSQYCHLYLDTHDLSLNTATFIWTHMTSLSILPPLSGHTTRTKNTQTAACSMAEQQRCTLSSIHILFLCKTQQDICCFHNKTQQDTVFSRSTDPASYVFRYSPFAILGPELSPI
jgi:non-ribosomal peptide synthetase component F